MNLLTRSGWYVDALPGGAYAYLVTGSHLETSRGRVELPGANVLYLDLAEDGVRIGGVGHHEPIEDAAQEWNGTAWVPRGQTVGPRSVIFDAEGTLQTVPYTGHPAGSQGYRQVGDNGQLVYSDHTYVDHERQIWEYTTRGDITIGQSGEGPHGQDAVLALYGGKRYILAEGQCRFIKFRRGNGWWDHASSQLAVSWVQEDRGESRVLWLTVAELQTFPEQQTEPEPPDTEPPDTEPPDVEPPEPEPPEPDMIPDSIEHLIREERAKYPAVVSFETGAQIINDACYRAGLTWGLSAKPHGNNVTGPSGDKVAYDIAQHRASNTLWDCFEGQEAGEPFEAIVIWSQAHPHNDPNRPWVAPVPPAEGGGGPGPEPPTAGTVDAAVQALIDASVKPLEATIRDLEGRLEALESAPPPAAGGLQRGDVIGLRSERNNMLLCNDENKPQGDRIQADDRDGRGHWESWKIE